MKSSDSLLFGRAFADRYFIVAVTTIVIAILMYVLADRLELEVGNVEKARLEFRLAELRAAVVLQEAALVARDEMASADLYEGSNPMVWLDDDTSHYLGEMTLEQAEGKYGNWVYDPGRQVIAYQLKPKEPGPQSSISQANWLQFKVVALWSEEQQKKIAKGLKLQAWHEEN